MRKELGSKRIKILVSALFVIMVFLMSCSSAKTDNNSKLTQKTRNIVVSENNGIVAVYISPKNDAVLSDNDLKAHPEVLKVTDFETLTNYTSKYIIPIWIDKDAIDMLPKNWINEFPQKFYPVIFVGYGNILYTMRDKLELPIFGPYVDWS
ncbi:MAG: hypothetical protein ACPLW7_01685, partial [Minisyncoccia bacterium]